MLWRETFKVRLWSFFKVPLLYYARPVVLELEEARTVVSIRLRRRTKNHLGSMYFGALCVGADVAGGLAAMRAIEESGGGMSLIFGAVNAEFLKRPEDDVVFTCLEGMQIRELVALARSSGEREQMPVHVTATVPTLLGDEPVAKFQLSLSLKQKGST